jgi:hypothetical protein
MDAPAAAKIPPAGSNTATSTPNASWISSTPFCRSSAPDRVRAMCAATCGPPRKSRSGPCMPVAKLIAAVTTVTAKSTPRKAR